MQRLYQALFKLAEKFFLRLKRHNSSFRARYKLGLTLSNRLIKQNQLLEAKIYCADKLKVVAMFVIPINHNFYPGKIKLSDIQLGSC